MSKVLSRQEVVSIINNLKRHNKENISNVKTNIDGKEFAVETVSISRYDYLKKSLQKISDNIENSRHEGNSINGVTVQPAQFRFNKLEVDNFIEKELKAMRDGTSIKWVLSDGVYKYDVFKDELTRTTHEN